MQVYMFDTAAFFLLMKGLPYESDINPLIHHCVKSAQVRNFFWSVFSCIRTEYRDLLCKYPYSVRTQENTEQKNSVFEHFSRSA